MIIPTQVSVGTTAIQLAAVPPGVSSVVLTNTGTVSVAIGTSNSVTATNGGVIPAAGSVTLAGFSASKGSTLWGIVGSGTAVVGIFISTAA